MFNCTTNRTANFTRCEWADTTGTFTEACLEVIYRAWNVTTSAYSGCDSSASSSLSYTYTDPSLFYDWQFTITHTVAGVTFELCGDSGTYSGNVTPDYEDWSLFLVFMVVITFAMLGATQGASMSLLGGGIGFALCAVAGLVAVSIEWVIGIFLALVVGAYLVSR